MHRGVFARVVAADLDPAHVGDLRDRPEELAQRLERRPTVDRQRDRRELTRIDNLDERRRLTKARLIAFTKLPPEQRQLIAAARRKAFDVDRGVMEADQKLVDELLPTLDPSVRSAYPQT